MSISTNYPLLKKLAIGASVAIPLLIAALIYIPAPTGALPFDVYLIPKFHALVNSLTVLCLILALYFVKNKNISAHKFSINTAMVLSVLFLLSYVVYHWATEPTKFGGEGTVKMVYYFFLLTHIVLSAAVIPFVLFTYIRGLSMQVEKHKKIAKYTYPLWLYVAVTGVICYVMLSPYYPS